MRAGADRWCVGWLRLCIHCLLLIRWIDGVDAGRVGVSGGGVGARLLNGTPNADVPVAPDDDDLRAASVLATGPSASPTRRPSLTPFMLELGCRGQADPHRRRPRAPRSGSGAAAPPAARVCRTSLGVAHRQCDDQAANMTTMPMTMRRHRERRRRLQNQCSATPGLHGLSDSVFLATSTH